jgi:hypothetical protein
MLVYQHPFLLCTCGVLILRIPIIRLLLWQRLFLYFRMIPSFLFRDRQCVRLCQILVGREYKLQDARRIRISVDITSGLPLQLVRKMMCLGYVCICYKQIKLYKNRIVRSLMMVITQKHVETVLMSILM